MRIFATQIEEFLLRGNNLVCAVAFQLLRGRAPAQLKGNIDRKIYLHNMTSLFMHFVKKKTSGKMR
jgi:hypothetical protein